MHTRYFQCFYRIFETKGYPSCLVWLKQDDAWPSCRVLLCLVWSKQHWLWLFFPISWRNIVFVDSVKWICIFIGKSYVLKITQILRQNKTRQDREDKKWRDGTNTMVPMVLKNTTHVNIIHCNNVAQYHYIILVIVFDRYFQNCNHCQHFDFIKISTCALEKYMNRMCLSRNDGITATK